MITRDYSDILSAFIAGQVEFLVVGAHALAAHGIPRATGDLDIWISPTRSNAEKVFRALAAFGTPIQGLDASELQAPGTVFQIGVAPNRIDILTALDGVSFSDCWSERKTVTLGSLDVPVMGRRHLISNKRAVGLPQDLVDVKELEKLPNA